jgi:hypothetical protein
VSADPKFFTGTPKIHLVDNQGPTNYIGVELVNKDLNEWTFSLDGIQNPLTPLTTTEI